MGILIKAPTRRRDTGDPVIVPPASADTRSALHIREVVRITGLRREQLYMWQRRYGFPSPLRDPFGDRVYPPDQVARLVDYVHERTATGATFRGSGGRP